MTEEEYLFFAGKPEELALYEAFREKVLARTENARITVHKTQITFANRHGFAFVSFLPARPKARRPAHWITVSFGLRQRLASPRIDQAVEPYPQRWTHHMLLSDVSEIDGQLLDWIEEAAVWAGCK